MMMVTSSGSGVVIVGVSSLGVAGAFFLGARGLVTLPSFLARFLGGAFPGWVLELAVVSGIVLPVGVASVSGALLAEAEGNVAGVTSAVGVNSGLLITQADARRALRVSVGVWTVTGSKWLTHLYTPAGI